LQVLAKVIKGVGVTVFQNTVVLVFAGHENYSNTNVGYLKSAIQQLQATLTQAGASAVPVGTALVSGDLVMPGSPADMQTLVDTSSPNAPLGFDPYPFQWGVTPPAQAASNAALRNSIAWDYVQVKKQSFYAAPKPILMAETGWATAGRGVYADYYCYTQGTCQPGVANAAKYLQAVYGFVRTPSNKAGVLVFEAYDEPAKDPVHSDDAENYYGLFNTNCNLKSGNTNFLPNTGFDPASNLGCQGFTRGSTFSIVGTQQGSETNQPPFKVEIQQTNPTTSKDASMVVTVPKRDRTDPSVNPWPYFLAFNGANIKITGLTSGASCTVTANVLVTACGARTGSGPTISWGPVSCTDPNYPVNCKGDVCYLPWNNF
jgi:exo-beta-1,3-glucanase (GH17 family)